MASIEHKAIQRDRVLARLVEVAQRMDKDQTLDLKTVRFRDPEEHVTDILERLAAAFETKFPPPAPVVVLDVQIAEQDEESEEDQEDEAPKPKKGKKG